MSLLTTTFKSGIEKTLKGLSEAGIKVTKKVGVPIFARWRMPYWLSIRFPVLQPLFNEMVESTNYKPNKLMKQIWDKVPAADFLNLPRRRQENVAKAWRSFDRNRSTDFTQVKSIYPDLVEEDLLFAKQFHDTASRKAMDFRIQTEFTKRGGANLNPQKRQALMKELESSRIDGYAPRNFGEGDWVVSAKDEIGRQFFYRPKSNEIDLHVDRAKALGFKAGEIHVKPLREFVLSDGRSLDPQMIKEFVHGGVISAEQGRLIIEEMMAKKGSVNFIRRKDFLGYDDRLESFLQGVEKMVDGSAHGLARAEGYNKMADIVRNLPAGDMQSLGNEMMMNSLKSSHSWGSKFKKFIYGWHLGMNAGFGLQNATQSFLNTLPEIIKYTGVTSAPKIWLSAGKEANDIIVASFRKKLGSLRGVEKETVDLAKRALNEGVVKGMMTEFLTGLHAQGPQLQRARFRTATEKAISGVGDLSERGLRMQAFVAGVKVGKIKGLKGESLYTFAKNMVHSTQFPFGQANTPLVITSMTPSLKGWADLATTFRLFTVNQMERMMVEVLGSKEFYVAGHKFQRTVSGRVAQAMTPMVLAGTSGIVGWQLLKGITNKYGRDPDLAIREYLNNATFPEAVDGMLQSIMQSAGVHPDDARDKLGDIITRGVPGMVGIDPSRWIGLGSLPFSPHDDIFGVAQSMPENFWRAFGDIKKGRGWDEAINLLPAFFKGPAQVMKWKEEGGVRAPDGELIYTPSEWDKVLRTLNVPQLGRSTAYEHRRIEKSLVRHVKSINSNYTERIARAIAEGNGPLREAIMSKVQEHNRRAPAHLKIVISPDSVRAKVRKIKTGRDYRTVPRRLRPRVREIRQTRDSEPLGGRDR